MSTTTQQAAATHLWPEKVRSHLFAVLDGAASPQLVDRLEETRTESVCLFSGQLSDKVRRASPHLALLPKGTRSRRGSSRRASGTTSASSRAATAT